MLYGINHAANLPAIDNQDMQTLLGTRIADYVIRVYRRTLAINLFLRIDSDIDLCREIAYLCEDTSDRPQMSDSAVDGAFKRQTMSPPKIVRFQGFCKGGFESKLAAEQLECINQSPILRQWFQNQLAQAIEDGKNAIMARFYRHLLSHAHPRNTGPNAGLISGGNQVGTRSQPVLFDPDNADKWMTSILDVIKQMPRRQAPENEYAQSTDDAFFFGPRSMESVLMQTEAYNSYDKVGDCATCALFKDVFDKMPRGIMPITSNCIESYTCESAGGPLTVYPVLFGKRYMGSKAAIRVNSHSYETPDKESIIYRTKFYHHIHTYDARFLGVSWVVVKNNQPATIEGCAA